VHAVDQIRGGDHARADGGTPGTGPAGGNADRPAEIA
jgi:hypothetical protein